jgi:hypothetical protein
MALAIFKDTIERKIISMKHICDEPFIMAAPLVVWITEFATS